MSRLEISYTNLGYGMLILLGLSFLSFAPAYFMVLHTSLPWIMHLHAVLMFAWMGILIAQPFLIRQKKYSLHRKVGKATYGLVPILLISGFVMIRYAYARDLNVIPQEALETGSVMSPAEVVHQARVYSGLGLYYFFGFLIFYPLAILYRRDPNTHAKFMIATSLAVVGPIVDRILFRSFHFFKLNAGFPLEYVSFGLIDLVMILLLYVDYKKGYPMRTSVICFSIYGLGQVFYFAGLSSSAWQTFAGWLLH
jgi:hypothetical protein